MHGTAVGGILAARRGSPAPAICPDCTLFVRPIFAESFSSDMPTTSPEGLAEAIIDCVKSGARLLNISAALTPPSAPGGRALDEAFEFAALRGVIAIVAAGNQGTVDSTVIARYKCVIPVAACDIKGRPMASTNLSASTGLRGLLAPGDSIQSLGADGGFHSLSGTSAAAPFVTGTIALLWSLFPATPAPTMRAAIAHAGGARRSSIVPPLLNAWDSYEILLLAREGSG